MLTPHTDRLVLVDREDNDDASSQGSTAQRRTNDSWRSCSSPDHDVLDKISYFALGFVLTGLVFAAIGFLYPRDFQRDPGAPARANENVDLEYMKLTGALNAITVTGIVLISIGGLILSALFTKAVLCQECNEPPESDAYRTGLVTCTSSQTAVTSQEAKAGAAERGQNYGAVGSAQSAH